MALYISTGGFRSRNLSSVVDSVLELGLTHLELSSGTAYTPDLAEQLHRLKAAGVDCLVHNYFPAPAEPFVLNLGSQDPAVLERSCRHVRECIDLSARLGKPYYSVHAAYVLPVSANDLGDPNAQKALAQRTVMPGRDTVYATFVKAVRELALYGKERNVGLLIENNAVSVPYIEARKVDPFLLTTAAEIEHFIAEIDAPNVAMLIDVAHARVSGTALGFDPDDFLRRTLPLARCVHLSDNDGREDQNLPCTEESWFWPLLSPYAHNLDFVIEVYKLTHEDIRRQIDLAGKMLGI